MLLTLAAIIVWPALVAAGAREGWLRPMPAAKADAAGFMRWANDRYIAESKGNFAMALLEHGRVAETFFASPHRRVDENSLFQVASMSKWFTAWGVMALADQHRIDLDAPISRYLTRWHLPPSEFDNNKVTARRLLSHTAGLTDGLGFLGFPPHTPLPTIEQELAHTADAQPGASGVIRVGAEPGDTWRYSGGGYLILQLAIEEITHEPFNDYMHHAVLAPLGMSESTFVNPRSGRLADFYDTDGSIATHYRYTALGAASLYTSVADMTRFLQAQIDATRAPHAAVLKPSTQHDMRKPHAFLYDLPVWGLGETLYAPDGAGSFVFGHDGNNHPAINTTARIDPATGDGIIVLETGNATLARKIGGEWTFWKTGIVSLDTIVLFDLRRILIVFMSGSLLILLCGFLIASIAGRMSRST